MKMMRKRERKMGKEREIAKRMIMRLGEEVRVKNEYINRKRGDKRKRERERKSVCVCVCERERERMVMM